MTSKTELIDNTTIKNIGGSVFVRIPPTQLTYTEIDKDNLPDKIKIGAAKGKHGKFLWIQKTEQQPPTE